jgi:hypothetical protein
MTIRLVEADANQQLYIPVMTIRLQVYEYMCDM